MKALNEIGIGKAWRFFASTLFLSLFGILLFPPLRKMALQAVGAKIGEDSIIHNVRFYNAYRTGFKGLNFGKSCFIADFCVLDLADRIILEDHVTLASGVSILTHTNVGYKDHPLQKYFPASNAPVTIKRGAFIGANSTILPGVHIGESSFVAAGSVVTKDVPPETVVGGIPACLIRTISGQKVSTQPII